jgi:hypothetical protein
VAASPQDKWLLTLRGIEVVAQSGEVFAHSISTSQGWVKPAIKIPGPPVATNPQDKWVLGLGGTQILVVTKDGKVFRHIVTWEG